MKPQLIIRPECSHESPAWWREFHRVHGGFLSDPWPRIDKALAEFNGYLVYHPENNGGIHCIEFDNEKSMTLFMLMWL